ncbi:hemolysin family protein [Oceanidesulfovibrio marinus]|uniref:HlyC/CorC family transporter n=1 Tax=Oceanidesulfovibrio marinus TaxID=370038 RepID=A0A6P1ZA33_9BACT|nr:hemolysin family protein [Oceanidesulfovibrio marinus]QJT08045.1 HlyC/CorC family transporter [Oceanidesulfovibrio marinus]TVM30436.1 magnesium/cobalt efflux protein [Oceanidesulfovibrio marinus]
MDEGSESGFWPFLSKLFSTRNGSSIEQYILEAKSDGKLEPVEVAMILNVLHLGRRQVQEIMVPRTDIVCVEEGSPLSEIVSSIIESGHSRIPVYHENRDNIIGIVHAKDLLKTLVHSDGDQGVPATTELGDLIRKPFFIPETKNVLELLQEFRLNKIHLAIALDEYGGTSGLVTFEDVLEEIVGEIEDEYDAPRPEEIQPLDDGSYLLSGRTSLEDLHTHTGLDLVSDQVETVGGYISEHAGRVPLEGERFQMDDHEFEIKEADQKQIRWIVLRSAAENEQQLSSEH